MTRKSYVVVYGVKSACGLHPGSKSWRPCEPCARAARATAEALADVMPITADGGRVTVTEQRMQEVRDMHAQGRPIVRIARHFGMSRDRVCAILDGTVQTTRAHHRQPATPNQRRAAQWYSPIQGEREHTKTIPYPTSTTERA
jgi:hypothetical protein